MSDSKKQSAEELFHSIEIQNVGEPGDPNLASGENVSTLSDPPACSILVKAYINQGGTQAELHGPRVEINAQGSSQRHLPGSDLKLYGKYLVSGEHFPFLKAGLSGEKGIKNELTNLKRQGFIVKPLKD